MSTLMQRTRVATIVAASIAALTTPAAYAQDSTDVVAIEEHWELVVGGPDIGRSAPQVSLVMSPYGHLAGHYFMVMLNHWSYPDFSSGGVQVQHWYGDQCVTAGPGLNAFPISIDNEVITWKQRISLDGGYVRFEVLDGQSDSWGAFGGSDLAALVPTHLDRLNDYAPAVSLNESGIGYAGNRVSSLTLQKIVWWTADGEQHELTAPIDIDADIDP